MHMPLMPAQAGIQSPDRWIPAFAGMSGGCITPPLCYNGAEYRWIFTMAERSFAKEVEALKLGDGEIFRGEGILAVTKALLQSGVAYVGGYQGAPVSHLLDVLVDAE